jgi:hypothetical protein
MTVEERIFASVLLRDLILKNLPFQCDYVGPLSRLMRVPDAGFPVFLDSLEESTTDKVFYKVTS